MYDKFLLEDLRSFKTGSESIYDLQLRYADISKIIVNRTKEKLNLLNLFLDYNLIDVELYNDLFERVKRDYKYAFLYLRGLASHLE